MNYFLIFDNSVQWFSAIVSSNSQLELSPSIHVVKEFHELPINFSCPYLKRIYDRRVNFTQQKFDGIPSLFSSCAGWDISIDQFQNIKRMIELEPAVSEFNRISL